MLLADLARGEFAFPIPLLRFYFGRFCSWVDDVEERGLEEVRKVHGYHDEPLKGDRLGQRSIRLNRAYRAIYEIREGGLVKFVLVEEVSKHAY